MSQPAAAAQGWLFDTNVVSELRKGPRADQSVHAFARQVPRARCHVSVVTLAEIGFGIERAPDPVLRAELERWLRDEVRPYFGSRIVPLDEPVLVRWRGLSWDGQKAGVSPSPPDALIAATALVHDLTVVTRNVSDFGRMGVPVLNPWTP